MKFHIYKTPYPILEEPVKIGTCFDFKNQKSYQVANLHFGKHTFESDKCLLCNQVAVEKRKGANTQDYTK